MIRKNNYFKIHLPKQINSSQMKNIYKTFFLALLLLLNTTVNIYGQVPNMVKDINPGTGSSLDGYNFSAVDLNGFLIFSSNDGTHGEELWISDASLGGTSMIKDINPGTGNSGISNFFKLNGELFFTATDGSNGTELCMSFIHTIPKI